MTRTPSVFPASSRPLPPSSSPANQSPRSHSTLPSASLESLSWSQSTPRQALPIPPSLVSRPSPSSLHRPLLSCLFASSNYSPASESAESRQQPSNKHVHTPSWLVSSRLRLAPGAGLRGRNLKEDKRPAPKNHHPVILDARPECATIRQPAVGTNREEGRLARSRRQGWGHGAGVYSDGHPSQPGVLA